VTGCALPNSDDALYKRNNGRAEANTIKQQIIDGIVPLDRNGATQSCFLEMERFGYSKGFISKVVAGHEHPFKKSAHI
jgi:hypothetical protein